MTKKIDVEKVFGARLYGRYPDDGEECGQLFREKILVENLKEHDVIELDFSHVVATPSSFFEEAFGGLVRLLANDSKIAEELSFGKSGKVEIDEIVEEILSRIRLKADDEFVEKKLQKVKSYMDYAAETLKNI